MEKIVYSGASRSARDIMLVDSGRTSTGRIGMMIDERGMGHKLTGRQNELTKIKVLEMKMNRECHGRCVIVGMAIASRRSSSSSVPLRRQCQWMAHFVAWGRPLRSTSSRTLCVYTLTSHTQLNTLRRRALNKDHSIIENMDISMYKVLYTSNTSTVTRA